MRTTPVFFTRRFKQIAMGTFAVLILTAVPAAALTWTTAWTTGFGAKGTVVVTASNNTVGATGPSTLTVNFGTSGGGKASGKFKASRSYTLAVGETRLDVMMTIKQLLQDAGGANDKISVKVKRGTISISMSKKGVYDQAASPTTIMISGA